MARSPPVSGDIALDCKTGRDGGFCRFSEKDGSIFHVARTYRVWLPHRFGARCSKSFLGSLACRRYIPRGWLVHIVGLWLSVRSIPARLNAGSVPVGPCKRQCHTYRIVTFIRSYSFWRRSSGSFHTTWLYWRVLKLTFFMSSLLQHQITGSPCPIANPASK